MSKLFAGVIALTLAAAPAFAQAPAPAAGKAKPAATKSDEQKRDEAALQARAQGEGQSVNTRVDLTITDSRGDGAPITKTVSIMTADRSWGRIRTQGEIRTVSGQRYPVILNVDARPWMILRENRAKVELTIEYRPADDVTVTANGTAVATPRRPDPDSVSPNINESLSVILEDGKTVLISQSADPVTDRKVKVEAKFTIVR